MPRRSNRTRTKPQRRGPSRSFRGRILVVTEDTESSRAYFDEVRAHLRISEENVMVVPGSGSDPVSVVDTAVSEARRLSTRRRSLDRVFVVIDRDRHESFPRALVKLRQFNEAAASGTTRVPKWVPPPEAPDRERFELVLSDPCFELWLLLHFTPWTSPFGVSQDGSVCATVQQKLKQPGRLPDYDKGKAGWWEATRERYETARQNAQDGRDRLSGTAPAGGTDRTDPSTTVDLVVEAIHDIARQR